MVAQLWRCFGRNSTLLSWATLLSWVGYLQRHQKGTFHDFALRACFYCFFLICSEPCLSAPPPPHVERNALDRRSDSSRALKQPWGVLAPKSSWSNEGTVVHKSITYMKILSEFFLAGFNYNYINNSRENINIACASVSHGKRINYKIT